jgi:hypothetical protein
MATAHDRPFAHAFAEWFDGAVDLHDIMRIDPRPDRDEVEISFHFGDGALHGYAHQSGISISAMLGREVWDFLWDEDVLAQHGAAGWFCKLCPAEDRPYYPSIEALWAAHLFEALRLWIAEKLRPAEMLEFGGGDGMTWARLATDDQQPDNQAAIIRLRRDG